VTAPSSTTLIGAAGGLAFVGGLEVVRRVTGQSERAISELGWAVIFGVTAVLLAIFGPPLVALAAAAMAAFEVLLTWRAWRRRPRDLLTQNREDLGGRTVPADDQDDRLGVRGWAFVILVGGVGIALVALGVPYVVAGLVMLGLGIVVVRFFAPPPPPDGSPRHVELPDDDRFWMQPTGRSFQFTVTGRRARVLGWVVSRFFRPPDPPPPR
jgi:hypothetical protein